MIQKGVELVGLKQMLEQEEKYLIKILQQAKNNLKNAPEGTLRLSCNKNKVQYYHSIKGGKYNGTYIPKSEEEYAKKLAQKDYDEKIILCAQKRLKQIDRILTDYEDDEIEQIFLKQHRERQRLVQPVEPTWEQLVKSWMEEEYEAKGFAEGTPIIYSARGERVRSKTERTIADFLYKNNVPYKYECPLYLKGYGTIYPDFTILSKKKRKLVYWEHDGKMDDPEYAISAVKKIQTYEDNGIILGDNLIITFETAKTVLNTASLERIIQNI